MLNKQIASKRGTSLLTIKVQRGGVMHKMQTKTVTGLIRFAQKMGIVSLNVSYVKVWRSFLPLIEPSGVPSIINTFLISLAAFLTRKK